MQKSDKNSSRAAQKALDCLGEVRLAMNKDHIKSFRINNIILAADANARLKELLSQKNAPKDFVDTIIRKIERDRRKFLH